MEINTTQSGTMKAVPTADEVFVGGVTEPSAEEHLTREEYDAASKTAEEVAYLHMARAWIDRWTALGGNFGLRLHKEGQPEGLLRGMTCLTEIWDSFDREHETLPPHTWLTEERHHDGAVKVLEALLVLCPGLHEAVRELGTKEAMSRWMHGQGAGQ